MTDAEGSVIQYGCNKLGRIVSIAAPCGNEATCDYGNESNETGGIDAAGLPMRCNKERK